MSEDLALFLRMALIGFAIAVPVGPMAILCMQRTLARGLSAGCATGTAIASADATYAALAAFGITAVSELLVDYQSHLQVLGGTVLIWLGFRALLAKPVEAAGQPDQETSLGRTFLSAYGLTLTNPLTIMLFGAAIASAGLVAQSGLLTAGLVTSGIFAGSLAWQLTLALGAWGVRHAISPQVLNWLSRGSGLFLMGFGLVALLAGVRPWL